MATRTEWTGTASELLDALAELAGERVWGWCMWWRAVSLVMAGAAILGVFVAIPIISAYAFWVLVAAMIVWFGVHTVKKPGLLTMTPVTLLVVAVVGIFVEIPIVSAYAFWVLVLAYLIEVSIAG